MDPIITTILSVALALLLLILGWLWSRINNVQAEQNDKYSTLEHSQNEKHLILEQVVAGLTKDINRVKIELPSNYATKEDLNILKSDMLTEVRETYQLVKDLRSEIKEEMKTLTSLIQTIRNN